MANRYKSYFVDLTTTNKTFIYTVPAETTDDSIDFVSNGFKMRTDSGGFGGGSGITYIYMAFAENPFVTSGGIPVTAR
jgi:hypothetical protein